MPPPAQAGLQGQPGHQRHHVRRRHLRQRGSTGDPGDPAAQERARGRQRAAGALPRADHGTGGHRPAGDVSGQPAGAAVVLDEQHPGGDVATRLEQRVPVLRHHHDLLQPGHHVAPLHHGAGEVLRHRLPVPVQPPRDQEVCLHHHPLHVPAVHRLLPAPLHRIRHIRAVLPGNVVLHRHEPVGREGPHLRQPLRHHHAADGAGHHGLQQLRGAAALQDVPAPSEERRLRHVQRARRRATAPVHGRGGGAPHPAHLHDHHLHHLHAAAGDPSLHQLHRAERVPQTGPDRPALHLRQLHHRPLGLHPALAQRGALLLVLGLPGPPRLLQRVRVQVVASQGELCHGHRADPPYAGLHHDFADHGKSMTMTVFCHLIFLLII